MIVKLKFKLSKRKLPERLPARISTSRTCLPDLKLNLKLSLKKSDLNTEILLHWKFLYKKILENLSPSFVMKIMKMLKRPTTILRNRIPSTLEKNSMSTGLKRKISEPRNSENNTPNNKTKLTFSLEILSQQSLRNNSNKHSPFSVKSHLALSNNLTQGLTHLLQKAKLPKPLVPLNPKRKLIL